MWVGVNTCMWVGVAVARPRGCNPRQPLVLTVEKQAIGVAPHTERGLGALTADDKGDVVKMLS